MPATRRLAPAVELRGAAAEELVALMQANGRGRRRGRVVALVGAVLGIVALGTGGVFAFQQLSGGGAQPESVLPSSTVAFAKVDLDPSAGQKVDAVAVPARPSPTPHKQHRCQDTDLRKVAFEAHPEAGQARQGRLRQGRRSPGWASGSGVGFVPDAAANEGAPPGPRARPSPMRRRAKRHLPALASGLGGQCRVLRSTPSAPSGTTDARLDAVVAATARGTLAEPSTFRQDMGDLGEDGVVVGLGRLRQGRRVMAEASRGARRRAEGEPARTSPTPAGRRWRCASTGPHLELAGHVNGAKAQSPGHG